MKLLYAMCRIVLWKHRDLLDSVPIVSGPNHANHKNNPVLIFGDKILKDKYLADPIYEWLLFKQKKIG